MISSKFFRIRNQRIKFLDGKSAGCVFTFNWIHLNIFQNVEYSYNRDKTIENYMKYEYIYKWFLIHKNKICTLFPSISANPFLSADILRAFLSPMSDHCRLSWLVNTNCGIMNHTEESNNHWWAKENIRWPGLWQSPQEINYQRKKLNFCCFSCLLTRWFKIF